MIREILIAAIYKVYPLDEKKLAEMAMAHKCIKQSFKICFKYVLLPIERGKI